MDQKSLQELIDSIRTHGVLEPIVVRPVSQSASQPVSQSIPPLGGTDRKTSRPPTYEIIMGERRFRACQALQKETIPAVVREADDRQMLEWALIENTHRKDLNPIERAKAYEQLARTFQLTHEEVARRVGVGRTTVTDFIRLLSLPAKIQADVGRQTIRVGHAMAILAIPDSTRRLKLWERVKNEDLSVRHLRIIVDAYLHPRGISTTAAARAPQYKELGPGSDPNLGEWYGRLLQKFGPNASVDIHVGKVGEQFIFGTISIGCHSEADLQRILKLMVEAQGGVGEK